MDQRSPSTQAPDDSLPQAEGVAAVATASDGDGAEGADEGFVASTLAELRKVVWPSRQQLFSESVAVIRSGKKRYALLKMERDREDAC